jgi:cytochrome c-type biogenesis protein CcmH/NrfG
LKVQSSKELRAASRELRAAGRELEKAQSIISSINHTTMKHHLLFAALMLGACIVSAQNDKYIQAMEHALAPFDTVRAAEGWQKAANQFERIAQSEPGEWLPSYYQAYCHMMLAGIHMQTQRMEACNAHLDQAQAALDAAKALAPQESEVVALQGYIYQGRIWENAMVKGAEYSPKVQQALQTAIALDAANPRPYYLLGQQLLYTPEFYGGGAKVALPWLEKAAAKFEAQQLASALHPRWGQRANAHLLGEARGENSK